MTTMNIKNNYFDTLKQLEEKNGKRKDQIASILQGFIMSIKDNKTKQKVYEIVKGNGDRI